MRVIIVILRDGMGWDGWDEGSGDDSENALQDA